RAAGCLRRTRRKRRPPPMEAGPAAARRSRESQRAPRERPRVVIVGAGFGGLAAAKALAGTPVDVIVIDRHNYHLFQPLLYQVATAGLSPTDVASPIRAIVRRLRTCTLLLGSAAGIDGPRLG